MSSSVRPPIVNINLGVLGHIDSGKTSLCRALSTHLSTAALDKAPESQRRGITLELGFSAFYVKATDVPESAPIHQQLQARTDQIEKLQFTLIDCPGHASLLRTILSGTSIMDCMLLVIDAVAGIQTQTAECLVISELMTQQMIVVINKLDLLYTTANNAQQRYEKLVKQVRGALSATKWKDREVPVVGVSTVGGVLEYTTKGMELIRHNGESKSDSAENAQHKSTVQPLIDTLLQTIKLPQRNIALNGSTPAKSQPTNNASFLFLVDHCFPIKGSGTVLTGTVLNGSVNVGDTIELPSVQTATSGTGNGLQRKIKSMQMFKQPVQQLIAGDRAGICVTQLDSKESFTHGIVCQPGSVQTYHSIIASVDKIKFYRSAVRSKQQYHITIANATVMATIQLFQRSSTDATQASVTTSSPAFDVTAEYTAVDELLLPPATPATEQASALPTTYALLRFDSPVQIPLHSLLIGSKLDIDITRTEYASMKTCRIAFSGRMLMGYDVVERKAAADGAKAANDKQATSVAAPALRLTKYKSRTGIIDRLEDAHTVIVRDMFTKNTDLVQTFMNFNITYKPFAKPNAGATDTTSTEADTLYIGTITSSFGQSSKVRVKFDQSLPTQETADNRGRKQISLAASAVNKQVVLTYRKHVVLGTRATNNKNVKQRIEPA